MIRRREIAGLAKYDPVSAAIAAGLTTTATGLANRPTPEQARALISAYCAVDQMLGWAGVRTYTITSGFRSLAVNTAVGGSPSSSHMRGSALDVGLNPDGVEALAAAVLEWIDLGRLATAPADAAPSWSELLLAEGHVHISIPLSTVGARRIGTEIHRAPVTLTPTAFREEVRSRLGLIASVRAHTHETRADELGLRERTSLANGAILPAHLWVWPANVMVAPARGVASMAALNHWILEHGVTPRSEGADDRPDLPWITHTWPDMGVVLSTKPVSTVFIADIDGPVLSTVERSLAGSLPSLAGRVVTFDPRMVTPTDLAARLVRSGAPPEFGGLIRRG